LPVLGIQNRIPYAVEDLLKLWGCGLLFLFAWDLCGQEIKRFARESTPITRVRQAPGLAPALSEVRPSFETSSAMAGAAEERAPGGPWRLA
jgi:hypothetical protein